MSIEMAHAPAAIAREQYIRTGVRLNDIRPEIATSWLRSRESRVAPDGLQLPFVGRDDEPGRLMRAAAPILGRFASHLQDTRATALLADRHGRVVGRWTGSKSLAQALTRLMIDDGFSLNEEHAGTNGIGTALERAMPTQVVGPEHYSSALHSLTCAGVPIRNRLNRRIEGVVNIACPIQDTTGILLATAAELANRIEEALLGHASAGERAVLEAFMAATTRRWHPVVAVAEQILLANPAARASLTPIDRDLLWSQLEGAGLSETSRNIDVELASGITQVRAAAVRYAGRTVGSIVEMRVKPTRRSFTVLTDGRGVQARLRSHGLVGISSTWTDLAEKILDPNAGKLRILTGEPGVGKRSLARTAVAISGRPIREISASGVRVSGTSAWLTHVQSLLAGDDAVVVTRADQLCNGDLVALADLIETARAPTVFVVADLISGQDQPAVFAHAVGQHLKVDPLRLRRDDILELWAYSLRTHRESLGLSPEATAALCNYDWPGNVAELNKVAESLVAKRGAVLLGDLPSAIARRARGRRLSAIEALERDAMLAALKDCQGNRSVAARRLGMSRSTFYRRMISYQLEHEL